MSKITAAQIAAQQAWITPTLATGWTNFDGGGTTLFGFPQYMKDSLGFVHLRGLTKNSSAATNNSSVNSTIFQLPAGYRPGWMVLSVVEGNDGLQRVDVNGNGFVFLAGTSQLPTGTWLSLNGIIFLAEN